jgi:hypothetical protein
MQQTSDSLASEILSSMLSSWSAEEDTEETAQTKCFYPLLDWASLNTEQMLELVSLLFSLVTSCAQFITFKERPNSNLISSAAAFCQFHENPRKSMQSQVVSAETPLSK